MESWRPQVKQLCQNMFLYGKVCYKTTIIITGIVTILNELSDTTVTLCITCSLIHICNKVKVTVLVPVF